MSENLHEPAFNLKVVVRETGLKPDTLRAWERRYGLPQPNRSGGGHRLYSQRDINILKWLVSRQQEGMSISRAVKLWSNLIENGDDPLRSSGAVAFEPVPPVTVASSNALVNFRQAWVLACLRFDEAGAEQVLHQAFSLYQPEVVAIELLSKGIVEIGNGWYEGGVTVQQEHFASELAIRRIEAMIMGSPPPYRPERILLGCPPEENHIFGPLLLNLFLRRRGWNTLYLGANVPPEQLQATIKTVKPSLIVMTAQQLSTAANLLGMGPVLAETRVPLAYGGRVFNRIPALRKRIPGHFLGENFEQAVAAIEKRLTTSKSPDLKGVEKPVSDSYKTALDYYLSQRKIIEIEVWRKLQQTNLFLDEIQKSYGYLANNIAAALRLGDINFLNEDVAWVEKLLCHRNIPDTRLTELLEIYHQAALTHLDERGDPITDWLSKAAGLVGVS